MVDVGTVSNANCLEQTVNIKCFTAGMCAEHVLQQKCVKNMFYSGLCAE